MQGCSLQGGCGGSDNSGGGGGGGGNTFLSFTAGDTIAIGDVLVFNNAARVIPANATNPAVYSSHAPFHVVGIAREAATVGNAVTVFTQIGNSLPVRFASSVSSSDVGKLAYLTTGAGTCTLTAPTSSAAVIEVGLVYSANGSTLANLIYFPKLLALLP